MKRRRIFKVYTTKGKELVASGVLYEEGNVQVLWRKDIGYTSEQYSGLYFVLGIVPDANTIEIKQEETHEST